MSISQNRSGIMTPKKHIGILQIEMELNPYVFILFHIYCAKKTG